MAALEFGLPSSLLLAGDPSDTATKSLSQAAIGDAFVPTGLLLEEPTTVPESNGRESSRVQGGEFGADSFPAPYSCGGQGTRKRFYPAIPYRTSSSAATTKRHNADAPLLFGEPALDSQDTSSQSRSQDEDLPDVAELLKGYTAKVASLAPVPSSSRVISTKTFDGSTIYFTRKPPRAKATAALRRAGILPEAGQGQRMKTLLDAPIHKMLEDLSVSAAAKIVSEEAQTKKPAQLATTTNTLMWVDRYRPSRFTELLGDDRVHREVLAWVKEWDTCVFGKHKSRGRKRARDDANGENLDQWRRPQEKLLLLSGPPGLGKTTLAHVVAQHAGYNVFEINASDARSADVVDERIRPALESGAMIGSSKPNLVVIDEIDGATGGSDSSGGFISKLIQLTYDRPYKKSGRGRGKGGQQQQQQHARPLLRPIICICNDLYASALTKLRQHARIVRFARPHDTHVVRRLREICEREGLRADARALAALVGVAQGDFRGCLNTLQMLKARMDAGTSAGGAVTEGVVRSATRGMKEAEVGMMTVLGDLFAPLSKRRAKEMGVREDEPRFVTRLSMAVESCDSLDKIAIGCFEHYAQLHRHDASFDRYLKGTEWLCRWDLLMGSMRAEREYALLPYMSYPLVAFYPLFQDRGAPKVERPKADWEHYTKLKTNEEIYKSLARCLRTAAARSAGDYRHLAHDALMQLELAPFLNRIISPPLRPVNSQVIRPAEKAVLARLVGVMANLELRFVQEKTEEGQLVYRLDPPIDVFVTYDGRRAADIAVSRYAVRHLVAAEIDAQVIARQAEGHEKFKGGRSAFFGGASKDGAAIDDEQPVAKRQRQEDKLAEKAAVDFFGRPIVAKDKPEGATGGPRVKPYRVAYKFNEGNSAAVRKPVKVAAWL